MLIVDGSSRRILAPFPYGERVWIAVLCSGNITVAAKHATGGPIPVVQTVGSQARKMIGFADIGRENLRPSIEDCAPASLGAAQAGSFHVAVTFTSQRGNSSIEVKFVLPDLFRSITGIGLPSTDPSDGYGGRLLP